MLQVNFCKVLGPGKEEMIPDIHSLKGKGRPREVKTRCDSFLLHGLHPKQVKQVHKAFYKTSIEWIDVVAHNSSC